jgi:signal transduction histidine kinase/ligand-binding sensor domain-containing protein
VLLSALAAGLVHAGTRPPAPLFDQLQHSVVDNAEDPVGAVRSIVQDSDGFLWLATAEGLVRFDGVSFTRPLNRVLQAYNPPFVLMLGPSGSISDLWVGHRINGVTHIVNGVATHYEGGTYPPGTTFVLERDNDGVLWGVTTKGVVRFVDGRWQPLPDSMGWPAAHPESFYVFRATGDIYVYDGKRGPLVKRYGTARFVETSAIEVWRASTGLPATAEFRYIETSSNADPTVMRDGTLWGKGPRGLLRSHWRNFPQTGPADIEETFTSAEGLSDNSIYAFLDDSEGDVWVGTGAGLDRFRRPHFLPRVFPAALTTPSMAADESGSIWVADAQAPPYRLSVEGDLTQINEIGAGVSTIAPEPDGSVWFAGTSGIQQWKNGQVTALKLPREMAGVQHRFLQLVHDANGDMWTNAHSFGLYKMHGGLWEKKNGTDGFPSPDPLFVARGPEASIWVTYAGGAIYKRQAGVTSLVTMLAMRSPLMLSFDQDDVWVGGDSGLVRFHAGMVQPMRLASSALKDVTGVVRGSDGSLWIASRAGVDRVEKRALEAFEQSPSALVPAEHYDKSEGLGENFSAFFGTPSLLRDKSGEIWHSSLSGVSSALPARLTLNNVRPRVFIEAVVMERESVGASNGLVLPALTRSLRLDYTAPMMRRPEHGRFEYQLQPVDQGWQAAGTRRSAFYTRLGPGTYTFRVRAFNEDNLRSETDAVFTFQIAAAWYQTFAFQLAVALTCLFVAWWAYTLRLKTVTDRLRIRHDEREHIARDLHDTLLQGFQGLILRFQAVRGRVGDDPQKLGRMIDEALARADQVMEEGRDKVSSLRSNDRPEADLPAALLSVAEELSSHRAADIEMVVHGKARSLKAETHEEALRISREAMINALLHSGCTRVDICVEYNRRFFEVTVRDNGVGFDDAAARPGHWGLKGMRERADRIHASLIILSRPTSGTEVTLRIRANRAYV